MKTMTKLFIIILVISMCFMQSVFALQLADNWEVNVKRLTYDDSDNYLSYVDQYLDTVEFHFGSSSGSSTVAVNTSMVTPRATKTLPNSHLGLSLEQDGSVDVYRDSAGDYSSLYVNYEGSQVSLLNNGYKDGKIVAVSSGVVAYESEDGQAYVWSNGQEYNLSSSTNSESIIAADDGIIAFKDSNDNLYVWKDGQQYSLDTGAGKGELVAINDGIVAFNDSQNSGCIWQDGQKYTLNSATGFTETIDALDGGLVAFHDETGSAYIWKEGTNHAISTSTGTGETVVGLQNGIAAIQDDLGQAYVWQDGLQYSIGSPSGTENIVAMKDDIVAFETDTGDVYIWQNGHTDSVDTTTGGAETVVGIGDGIVAIETSTGEAFVWKDGNQYFLTSGSGAKSVVAVDGSIVAYKTEDGQIHVWDDGQTHNLFSGASTEEIVGVSDGVVAVYASDGHAHVYSDGDFYSLQTTTSTTERVMAVANGGVVFEDQENNLYYWKSGQESLIENSVVEVVDELDGKVVYTTTNLTGTETYLNIWENGTSEVIASGTNFSSAGFVDGSLFYIIQEDGESRNIYKYSTDSETSELVSEDVDYVNTAFDGKVYFNKYNSDSDSYEKWVMEPNGTPYILNDIAYTDVHSESSYEYDYYSGSYYNNELIATNDYYGEEVVDSFTSGVDQVYAPAVMGGSYQPFHWEYADREFDFYDPHGPKLDNVTNEVAWDRFYRPDFYDTYGGYWGYDAYGNMTYISYPNTSHGDSTVYWSHNDNSTTTPIDEAEVTQLSDPQYRVVELYRGVMVTVGYTSESLSQWPNQYVYEKRIINSERIYFNDGSFIDTSIFFGFTFEPGSYGASWEDNYWVGLKYYGTYGQLDDLSTLAMLYYGTPEGETDDEFYLVYLTPTATESGGDPGDDLTTIPEPVTMILLSCNVLCFYVFKWFRRK